MMEVKAIGSCVVIHMKCGKNVFNSEFAQALHEALDKSLEYKEAKAVVTIGEGRFYGYGFDLDVVKTHWAFSAIMGELQTLLRRLMTFPLVTVAAINGHSFGAGGLLALAHDYRVMRSDRGWFCLPVVWYKRTLPTAIVKLIKSRILPPSDLSVMVYGHRFTAEEAKAAGILQEVSTHEKLKEAAIAAAHRLAGAGPALDRNTVSALKQDLYRDVCQSLGEPVHFNSKL